MFDARIIVNEPAYRPRPTEILGYHRFSNGEFDAFVHKDNVLHTIADWARQRDNEEIIGRLVGRPYRDERGNWSVVTGAILSCYEGGPTTVRTNLEDAAETCRVLEQDHPSEDLLGWYHSHICPVDEYSPTDNANQAEWTKPYHLGLLVVVRDEFITVHAFRGPEGERLTDSYIHAPPQSRTPNESQLPTLDAPLMSALRSPVLQTPSRITPIASLLQLVVWPLVFLVGIHIIADSMAQIRPPIVVQQSDDWKPVAEQVNHTGDVVESLKTEVEKQMSHTEQQQIQEIQEYYKRNQDGMEMLNWIAGQLSFDETESVSEVELDNQ